MSQASKVTPLFDNLVNLKGLQTALEKSLGRRYSESAIRNWVRLGMPVVRLRTRELFFRPDDVALWLQRSS